MTKNEMLLVIFDAWRKDDVVCEQVSLLIDCYDYPDHLPESGYLTWGAIKCSSDDAVSRMYALVIAA